ARADAAADAAARLLGALGRLDAVQFHVLLSYSGAQSTFTRYDTFSIIPRTAGVSSSVDSLLVLRRPRPRTVARCDSRVPATLLTSLILTVFLSAGLSVMFVLRVSRRSLRPSGRAWPRSRPACCSASGRRASRGRCCRDSTSRGS